MKTAEAQQLAGLLQAAFPIMSAEQVALYARLLEPHDADAASRAILRGIDQWHHPPRFADIRDLIRVERRATEPAAPRTGARSRREPIPFWVKRWVCARWLHARFDRPQDMRWFREEHAAAPPDAEFMPEEEWVVEAQNVPDEDVWALLKTSRLGILAP